VKRLTDKLYKSNNDKVIDGVCGGLADYLEVDSSIVRILWALAVFVGGTGILLYIIAAIILPRQDEVVGGNRKYIENGDYDYNDTPKKNKDNKKLMGVILIAVGIILTLKRFLVIFDEEYFLPILLIVLGGFILFKNKGANNEK